MSERWDVEIGTAIVSYIEPEPGYEREFDAWYGRDHFPATVLGGPGVFSGARFVATRECRAARPPTATLFGDPARGRFLAIAWVLRGKQAEWEAWVAREMTTLAEQGRLFPHREHLHTAIYRFEAATGAMPASLALAHGFPGVIVLAGGSETGVSAPAVVRLTLERPVISSADPPPHDLTVVFCREDPIAAFAAAARLGGLADAGFASPFHTIVPGEHAYLDDL